MNTIDYVKLAKEALLDKKAENISIIDISKVSTIADYFIITDGANISQVHALADNVAEKLGRAGLDARAVEGYTAGNWILMDYGDIIVNVFSKDDRKFYNLERVWQDGKVVADL